MANGKNDAPKDLQDTENEGTQSSRPIGTLFGLAFYLILGLFLYFNITAVRSFVNRNVWPFAISGGIILLLSIIALQRSEESTGFKKRQISLTIFIAFPILAALIAVLLLAPEYYQIPVLRSVFLIIVCLLPAVMYYLFIFSRKSSLLQEYFSNLSRLGLFDCQFRCVDDSLDRKYESELDRRVRVLSYIQKFEAVYGSIPSELTDEILDVTNPDNNDPKNPTFSRYSTGEALRGILTTETTLPVMLATLIIGLGWLLTLPPWEIVNPNAHATITEKLGAVLQPGQVTIHFAFLGAYFFSVQMLFRRYIRKDLRANAYMAVSLRVILAVIGTWIVMKGASYLNFAGFDTGPNSNVMLVTAFVIGAFPPIAWQVIQTVLRTVTGARFFVPSLRTEMPVSELDGLTVWHEARLEEEDIENVPNMATADLVELMLHTRVPPERIIDWVDQAILYKQLGLGKKTDKRDKDHSDQKTKRQLLEEHGIRTASALIVAYKKSRDRCESDKFESIMPNGGYSYIRSLVDAISTNPNLALVMRWRCLPVS